MKSISIRDLHERTGAWVRRAASYGKLVITDRGLPLATLEPYDRNRTGKPLPDREAEIRKLSRIRVDSGRYLSDMRDRP